MTKFVCFFLALQLLVQTARAQYADWMHTGLICILTNADGANLPADTLVVDFPLLVRLEQSYFDFEQSQSDGRDLRFSENGMALHYQIEEWDAANKRASIWVRVPKIIGNFKQTIQMHWGNATAKSESNASSVFNESNGYASVWHMCEPVVDDVRGVVSQDQGTTSTRGMVGLARHFAGNQGIFGGDKIQGYPSGVGPMSTEAWFRAERTNGTVLAWGEEKRPSKVMMNFLSPPRIAIQCYFADVEAKSKLSMHQWYHVVHTYSEKDSRVYIDGKLDGVSNPVLDLPVTSRLWIGGWYGNYRFVGDVDEVRISKWVRSPEWIKLQYENQKPLNTLVGPLIQTGDAFEVSPSTASIDEGGVVNFTVNAGGAQKLYWSLIESGKETSLAVDRFDFSFDAGRISGDKQLTLQCKAVYPAEVKSKEIPIHIKETIADPQFTLEAPTKWDGRKTIEVLMHVSNSEVTPRKGLGELRTEWSVKPFAVIQEIAPGKLILKRAQNSGQLTVTARANNGGVPIEKSIQIDVSEPSVDPWVERVGLHDERPEEGQFYARDDKNEGHLHFNGTLRESAEIVFLKVYADNKVYHKESTKPAADGAYRFTVNLKPGLVQYRVEFGSTTNGVETVLERVGDLVCGDAFLIDGQSNGLATDTSEQSPAETNPWIRSYGLPPEKEGERIGNLWCKPVWKARKGEKAELGWWGMKLAERLLESQRIPIFIINGAVGGTRIDQHQRNASNPSDRSTLYGRTLWRIQQAKLTHGIRGILWHQGENDQGADGPTGGYGWETYQAFFVDMSAGWKQDFPNVKHYYVFQIWPNSCGMGGRLGSGDKLREVQRTLPQLYSNMSILSTLGVRPAGPCHFPLKGWEEFAVMIQPLIERDHYGKTPTGSITPPNLKVASYEDASGTAVSLEFDQPVVWSDNLASQLYLDGEMDLIASGQVQGNVLMLLLKKTSQAKTISYLKEVAWSQENLLLGKNGMAAFTFCEVPIRSVAVVQP